MIILLSVINALLVAAVIYLYQRQIRFERAVNQFANRLPELFSPAPMLKGAAVGFLIVMILKKLFSTSEDENPTA